MKYRKDNENFRKEWAPQTKKKEAQIIFPYHLHWLNKVNMKNLGFFQVLV
jgi:hypothetical protein